jgi:DNA-binding Lrp family transcriptional regulator
MATALTDRVLEILPGCPYGLTANEIASRLEVSPSNIGSRLSKLVAYGIIKKTHGRIALQGAAVCDLPRANCGTGRDTQAAAALVAGSPFALQAG